MSLIQLDLVLINEVVFHSLWSFVVEFKPATVSNHCLIWLEIKDGFKKVVK